MCPLTWKTLFAFSYRNSHNGFSKNIDIVLAETTTSKRFLGPPFERRADRQGSGGLSHASML